MGISQVPPVPTPTTKGDIVVGTATGPVRLPVGTTNNQTLLVDSTTASGLKYGSPTLTGSLTNVIQPQTYAITAVSYTNPNVTITVSTTHNFQIGNRVQITGMIFSAAQTISGVYTLTSVGSNTITFNYGATAPSTYTSGGTIQLYVDGNINGSKVFSNGVAVVSTTGGSYFYTTDNVTWNVGSLPLSQPITAMEYDGVNYLFGTRDLGIYSNASLGNGGWTQRTTFGGFFVHAIKWCAGSVNRVVAVGSSTAAYNGAGARIEVATQGGTSWTNQTISGTNSYAAYNLDFDGSSTIVTFSEGMGPIISTAGAGSWVGYTAAATNQPSGASVPNLSPTFGFSSGFYNSASARWVGFSIGGGYINGHTSAAAASPSSAWTRTSYQMFPFSYNYQVSGFQTTSISNPITFDSARNLIYAWTLAGGDVKIWAYNATPTVPTNSTTELYPVSAVYTAPCGLATFPNGTATNRLFSYAVGYGSNKWAIGVNSNNVSSGPGSYLVGIYQ